MSYYNTTHLAGSDLRAAIRSAKSQDDVVLLIFRNTEDALGPHQIQSEVLNAGYNWPLTSIRRSITALTGEGKLIKTSEMIQGSFGKPVHKWRAAQ